MMANTGKDSDEILSRFLTEHSRGGLLSWEHQAKAAQEFACSVSEVEKAALTLGILPARYQRNQQLITPAQQLGLFCSQVAIVGCGGLGGYVIEGLARLGIGSLTIIDPDVFVEHNLNRQLFATIDVLGKPKVKIAALRLSQINPAITVKAHQSSFSRQTGPLLIQGMDIVVDALDSIPSRLELAEVCSQLNIPLVHGSIAGWYGQVALQVPKGEIVKKVYGSSAIKAGIETELGSPSFTPTVIAGLQVAEVCKYLLKKEKSLENRLLLINLLDTDFVNLQF